MPTTDVCVEVLKEALTKYGRPKIFNTDQGSQFTTLEFTQVLQSHGIRISMDRRGRWVDDVFVERLWSGVNYEEVYLHGYGSIAEANRGTRPDQGLRRLTPDAVHFGTQTLKAAA